MHPEEKTQVLAYDSTYRKKNKPKNLPLEENHYNHLANTNVAMSPMYPLTPNICVEGGKIEFIKSPPESARNSLALASPPQTPLLVRRGSREKREARIYDEPTEKFDGDKVGGAVLNIFFLKIRIKCEINIITVRSVSYVSIKHLIRILTSYSRSFTYCSGYLNDWTLVFYAGLKSIPISDLGTYLGMCYFKRCYLIDIIK